MTKEKKSKILTAAVVVVLCVIFVGGFAIGLNSVLAMEGAYPPNVLVEGKTPVPESAKAALEYLDTSLENAIKEMPETESERKIDIAHDGSGYTNYILETDGSKEFTDTAKYIIDEIDNDGSDLYKAMLGSYEAKTSEFGKDNSGIIRIPELKEEDIKDFKVDYIYYHCSSCGEDSDEPLDNCELCGSELPYQEKYRDEYTVTLYFDNDNEDVLNNNFAPLTSEEAVSLFKNSLADDVIIKKAELNYSDLSITYKVKRLTDEITYLAFDKNTNVDALIIMNGKYADLGEHKISFTVETSDRYYMTWPSLELSAHEMTVEPKGNDNLQATLTCDDPTKQEVVWTSSDENILTVDNEGYFKAGKEAGKATITASFEYNGKTYTDSCEVSVKYSVESMKMNKKNVKLNVGDTAELKATVSPRNATIKTVTWYTEDESIAIVDVDGIVKAVAPGVVTVYALSDDGFYKSSSEVTVR